MPEINYSYIPLNACETSIFQFLKPQIVSEPYLERPVKSAERFSSQYDV